MHSTLVRLQNVFGFFTTVTFAVGALIAASDLFHPRTPSGSIEVGNLQVARGRPHYYSNKKEEYASIKFNLDADLSSLFTWNTKQIFVYVSASWPSNTTGAHGDVDVEKGEIIRDNEAVIWDTIITSPSADTFQDLGPTAMKKLIRSAKGRALVPERGLIKLNNQKAKYYITSPSGKLANTENLVLKLHYNVQPWVGVLTWTPWSSFGRWQVVKGGVSKAFGLPAVKVKAKA